jgi:hypothetical protein
MNKKIVKIAFDKIVVGDTFTFTFPVILKVYKKTKKYIVFEVNKLK